MGIGSNLLNSGLDPEDVEPARLDRIRTINVGLLVMAGIAIPFTIQYAMLGLYSMAAAVLSTVAIALLTLWWQRRTQDVDGTAIVAGLTVLALLVVSNVISGGFYDPNFSWLYVVPVMGALLGTHRGVWFFGGLVVIVTLAFWALPQLGVPIENQIPAKSHALQSLFNRLSAVLAISILVAILVIHHRRNERRIERMANFDELTGLPNRRYLERELASYVRSARRQGSQTAILLIDLDRFKTINDTLGHRGGDLLLCEVARRIVDCVPQPLEGGRFVARFGGDEFVVLFECGLDEEWIAKVAAELVERLHAPFEVGDYELFPGGSVGIAIAQEDECWEDLLRRADNALYEAKRRGGGCCVRSTAELIAAEERRLHLESMLGRALEREELWLAFQPLVSTVDERVVACEALLRWESPNGSIPPGEFIPIAEQTGHIVQIGRFVLEAACRQLGEWQRAGLPDLRMSVNVSALQLHAEGFVAMVAEALESSGLTADKLELELTESALVDASEVTQRAIAELAELGVGLALDDFGTGYSSLSYLSRFPFQTLKIDRSFVLASLTRRQDEELVSAIAMLGKRLSLRVVAEGVETADHVELLRRVGCDELQGYYFSRPIAAEPFAALIREGLPQTSAAS